MSRGHSRRVVARRGRRADDRRHRHGADPTGSGARPDPVPADQLDQLDQLAALAREQRQQQPMAQPARLTAPSRPVKLPAPRPAGPPSPTTTQPERPTAPSRPGVDDGRPCACQDDGPKCLLHYSARRR